MCITGVAADIKLQYGDSDGARHSNDSVGSEVEAAQLLCVGYIAALCLLLLTVYGCCCVVLSVARVTLCGVPMSRCVTPWSLLWMPPATWRHKQRCWTLLWHSMRCGVCTAFCVCVLCMVACSLCASTCPHGTVGLHAFVSAGQQARRGACSKACSCHRCFRLGRAHRPCLLSARNRCVCAAICSCSPNTQHATTLMLALLLPCTAAKGSGDGVHEGMDWLLGAVAPRGARSRRAAAAKKSNKGFIAVDD